MRHDPPSVALCVVVVGDAYHRYARDLFDSAHEFFQPTEGQISFHQFSGVGGWPSATMLRWHILGDHLPESDYIFLSDADMVFESEVGPEILGRITATLHPGYVNQPRENLPYESRWESSAYVPDEIGEVYYAGGFAGGEQKHVANLAAGIANIIDRDSENGLIPCWHDESALNKILAFSPPSITLSPEYCHPDRDSYYKTIWDEPYERKLVALDKTKSERGNR